MGDVIRLGAGDDGTKRQVKVGDTIVLSLEENPTTGFLWHLELVGDDALSVFDQGIQLPRQPGPESQSGIGRGGTRTFRLTADAPGETQLTLGLRRPWESGKPPLESLAVRITVRP
jgi:inhibitor of cysteine peptidase